MKKFDRLPPEKRKEEIKAAAMELFLKKGFAATTMENIVEKVSLSKGGLYRLYPSTADILSDLMIDGMRLRNAFYIQRATEVMEKGEKLKVEEIADMICDSLLLYPEVSALYVEFLWEKRRNEKLETLYQEICTTSIVETMKLIESCRAGDVLDLKTMEIITELMNTAILGIHILGMEESFLKNKEVLKAILTEVLMKKNR